MKVGDGIADEHGDHMDLDSDPNKACLVDTWNGFNQLNHKLMLWHVRHCWPSGAFYAFNCYKYAAQLVLRHPGEKAIIILSKEGITQGCPLAMVLYGIALLPLALHLCMEIPETVQP